MAFGRQDTEEMVRAGGDGLDDGLDAPASDSRPAKDLPPAGEATGRHLAAPPSSASSNPLERSPGSTRAEPAPPSEKRWRSNFLFAYGNLNMGAGLASVVAAAEAERAVKIAAAQGVRAFISGAVEDGEPQVVIEPLDLVFAAGEPHVRA